MEQTFVALKPDAVQRGLVGVMIDRLERKGFKLVGLKLMRVPRSLAEEHYGEHREKPFFKGLVDFICSGPIVAMVWEGNNAVESIRKMMGATNPKEALPGTLRGDFAVDLGRNVIHGSDSVDSAKREINLFFSPDEVLSNWSRTTEPWVYEQVQSSPVAV